MEKKGIDIAKFVFSLMIVAMHANILDARNTIQYKIQLTFFALAVPYFFISSGYFLGLKNCVNVSTSSIEKSIKHFCKLYIIFGSWYFLIQLAKIIFVNRNEAFSEIIELLHHLLVESPGGAQWYTYTCIISLVILYFANAKEYNIRKILVLFTISYFAGSIMMMDLFKYSNLRIMYEKIFISDRNVFCFGVYFFCGYVLGLNNNKIKWKHKILPYVVLLVYMIYGMLIYDRSEIGSVLIFSALKLLSSICLFLVTLYFNPENIETTTIRKLSTITYFTHYTFVYVFVFLFSDVNHLVLGLSCTIVSLLFSCAMLKFRKGYIYEIIFR